MSAIVETQVTLESLSDTAAGWPIFGQFVAHDITADRSALQSHGDSTQLRNARSQKLKTRLNNDDERIEFDATCECRRGNW
jgi:hypothetical protein